MQLDLEEYERGQEDAVKRYLQVCNTHLLALIQLVLVIPTKGRKQLCLVPVLVLVWFNLSGLLPPSDPHTGSLY